MRNLTIDQTLKRIEPYLKDMDYGEKTQFTSLIKELGYMGALHYLDDSVPRPWNPDRCFWTKKHFDILKEIAVEL